MIIVLKRFIYNNEENKVYKNNGYYQFPLILETKNYLKSNNIINNNIYNLNAILIHKGNDIFDHYYPIIKYSNSSHWFLYNDRFVEEFNINNIELGGRT